MKRTVAQNFISKLDSASFRDLVWLVLQKRGFKAVDDTDGSYDGGTDFRVYIDGFTQARIAVQVSVEKDWAKKLERDALKAKKKLGLDCFDYISSRRIPEASFQVVSERLREQSVVARKLDAPALAGYIVQYDLTSKLLELCGIPLEEVYRAPSRRLSVRDEAALACTLFSDESHDFRKGVIESAVCYVLMNAHPERVGREALLDEVKSLMGQGFSERARISSEVDSLLTRGYLTSTHGALGFSETASSEISATVGIRDALIAEAIGEIRLSVQRITGRDISLDDAQRILDLIGALIREGQDTAVSPLLDSISRPLKATEFSRQRFQSLHRILDELGIDDGTAREELVFKLSESIAQSNLGCVLAAGELYINMASHNGHALKVALDGGSEIRVLLDASVAMPLLIGLMHGREGGPSSDLALHFYQMCRERDIGLSITDFYVSECASHLVNAFERWGAIADSVPELAGSENYFVAAFARLKQAGKLPRINFANFLVGLGLAGFVRNGDRQIALDQVSSAFGRIFARSDIKIERSIKLDAATRRRVGAAFDHLENELERSRQHILVRHDEKAVCILEEKAAMQRSLWWFCTWHGLHFSVARELNSHWMPFTPIGLIELLGTLVPMDIEPPTSVAWLIRIARESTVVRAAMVWDTIAKIEHSELENADLLALAHSFHGQYMATMRDEPTASSIRDEWKRFKQAHGYADGNQEACFDLEEPD